MVSLSNVHVIGSYYMAFHGGFKPLPDAFIHYFRIKGVSPRKIFFIGNRLVDMKLANALESKLKCKVFKCLIIRNGLRSIAKKRADAVVSNLLGVSEYIAKFKPDLVMSDFDNTLVFTGHDLVEYAVEKLRFWEHYGSNRLIRLVYAVGSFFASPFIRRKPFVALNDHTEAFIRTLKCPLLIHSMSPESAIWRVIDGLLK